MKKRGICSALLPEDIAYLSSTYGLTADFIAGMDDADWCDLIGCAEEDLSYYLFDELITQTEPEDVVGLYGDDDFNDTLFDLSDYIERQYKEKPISKTVTPTYAEYSRPSKYSNVKSVAKVPHHFELVS